MFLEVSSSTMKIYSKLNEGGDTGDESNSLRSLLIYFGLEEILRTV